MAFIFGLAGAAVSAMGTIAGGNAANSAAQAQANALDFRAKQEEMAGMEARASSQREAGENRRAGDLAQSQLQARAASSGGGATDPTIALLDQGIAGRSEYGALMERYKGESRFRGLMDQAVATRYTADATRAEGEAKKNAAMYSAFGSLLGGAGSAFSQFSGSSLSRPLYGAGTSFGYG